MYSLNHKIVPEESNISIFTKYQTSSRCHDTKYEV